MNLLSVALDLMHEANNREIRELMRRCSFNERLLKEIPSTDLDPTELRAMNSAIDDCHMFVNKFQAKSPLWRIFSVDFTASTLADLRRRLDQAEGDLRIWIQVHSLKISREANNEREREREPLRVRERASEREPLRVRERERERERDQHCEENLKRMCVVMEETNGAAMDCSSGNERNDAIGTGFHEKTVAMNFGDITESDIISMALRHANKEWRRCKIMIVGQGRAGKSALANSIIGKPFENTESTVGINQLVCNVSYALAEGGSMWSEYKKPEKELEAALASIIHNWIREKEQRDTVENFLTHQKVNGKPTICETTDNKLNECIGAAVMTEIDSYGIEGKDIEAISNEKDENCRSSEQEEGKANAEQPTFVKGESTKLCEDSKLIVSVDEKLVMECLLSAKTSNNLIVSVHDFGGQSVFDIIHHLFLTRNGVYVVAFNMEWLLRPGSREFVECLSYLRFWLNSVIIHTYDAERCCTAPIVLVGTRKDTVSEPVQHEAISMVLFEAFSHSRCWPSLLVNKMGIGMNGCTTLCFFPVNNKNAQLDDGARMLREVVEAKLDESPLTHRTVPLAWLKVLDLLQGSGKSALPLMEVAQVGERLGMAGVQEVEVFLRFLHEMGMVVWHDERSLRDVVILDPVAYFVTPATIVICQHGPNPNDSTQQVKEIHREGQQRHPSQWLQLVHRGVLDVSLLQTLWKEWADDITTLTVLLVKFGLFVPLYDNGAGNCNSFSCHPCASYLVPALLPQVKAEEMDMIQQWTDGPVMSFVLVFSAFSDFERHTTINRKDLAMYGFLPSGLFERVVGKAVAWSQATSRGGKFNIHNVILYRNIAVLSYGRQRFRLMSCPETNCIRVDIEGKNPLTVHERLLEQVRMVLGECMKLLCCFSAVLFSEESESGRGQTGLDAFLIHGDSSVQQALPELSFLIPIELLRDVVECRSVLNRPGGRKLFNETEVRRSYGAWLHVYGMLEQYDIFLSYRQPECGNGYDGEVVAGLFDTFTSYSTGNDHRSVDVFLDKKRLKDGHRFDVDFVNALTNTTVVVPLVSTNALERMLRHDPKKVDHVLLEWIIAMECYHSTESRVQAIFPVAIGRRLTCGDSGKEFSDLFRDDTLSQLPDVVPRATIDQAIKCLDLCNKSSLMRPELLQKSLRMIVDDLMRFNCFNSSECVHHRLVADVAARTMNVLAEATEKNVE